MTYHKLISSVLLSLSICVLPGYINAAQKAVPTKSLILGVPYVSWNKASQMEYDEKNILNPATVAGFEMVLGYWGASEEQAAKWFEAKNGESLDDLKILIVRGIPVPIGLPLTPVSHQLYRVFEALAIATKEISRPERGLCSWMAGGRMASLEWIREFRDWSRKDRMDEGKEGLNPLGESLYLSVGIMIGYDDDREVVILHSPTYGPAWEVDYDTFDKMWREKDRGYTFLHPPNYAERLAQKKAEKPYRERTPDERAAFHLLYGCGLSSARRREEAENQLNEGIAIKGISKGYRHILLFELARHQAGRGAIDEAIVTTQAAIDALPKNYFVWQYLADLYRLTFSETKYEKAAKRAEKEANKLKKQRRATQTVARTLPSDFFIPDLRNIRGWGLATAKR